MRLCALLLPGILLLAAMAGRSSQPLLAALPKHEPCCGPITPAGDHLASVLDDMNVESLWIAGQHINWETGKPDRGGDYEGPGNHTHCSAFSAAAAKRLGIYLLRPPEHGQLLLANAQSKWLESAAAEKEGWHRVQQPSWRVARGCVVLCTSDPLERISEGIRQTASRLTRSA